MIIIYMIQDQADNKKELDQNTSQESFSLCFPYKRNTLLDSPWPVRILVISADQMWYEIH